MEKNGSVRNVMATIRFLLPSLTPAEKRVADFILNSPREASGMALRKMAKRCEVGEATVVRLCKTIGVNGYAELKELLKQQAVAPAQKEERVKLDKFENMEQILENVFRLNILNLKKTLEVARVEEYKSACEAIVHAKRINFFAIGDAMLPCTYARLRFCRIGYECYAESDADFQIINASNMEKGDVAIAVSHSGKTKQVIEAMRIAHERGATTICITKAGKSELTKYSDIILYNVTIDASEDKTIIARRVAEQAMLDAIYMGVVQQMEASAARQSRISENLKVNKIADKTP